MLTSGTLAGLQEVLASWIAQDRSRNGHFFTSRVPKMAIYGAFISAPMGHFLVKLLHFLFSNRTSLKAKILEILVSNLLVHLLLPLNQSKLLLTYICQDCTYAEQYLPGQYGRHRRRTDIPSNSRHSSRRVLARDARDMDQLTALLGFRPAIPPTRSLGPLLQLRLVLHRYICQLSHQEEAPRSVAPQKRARESGIQW